MNTLGNETEKSTPLVTANLVSTPYHELNQTVHRPEHALDGASVTPALLISEDRDLAGSLRLAN